MRIAKHSMLAGVLAVVTAIGLATPAAARPLRPTGATDVVLRVATGGGFVSLQVSLAEIPEITVYGDGRAIVLGPTTLEYPGPALPNLQEFRLTRRGLDRLIALAREAGVLAKKAPDFGSPDVTDNPTTTVTVNARGSEHRVSVYALRFGDDSLTERQQQNRSRLKKLIARAGDVDRLRKYIVDGSEQQYEPTALDVSVLPGTTPAPSDPATSVRVWPLGDLAPFLPSDSESYPCFTVSGDDLGPVLAAVRASRASESWTSGTTTYELVFRPLLPDERGCGDDVVVRIDVGRNGWGGENSRFAHADIVVYAAGRMTIDGTEHHIDATAVAQIQEAAEEAGLTSSSPDYGEPSITDQGSVVVEVAAAHRVHRVAVYALGMENVDDGHLGLSRAQLRARRQLAEFIDLVAEITTS